MKVIVVEDERVFADTIARGLRAEGFAVDVATNGRDGLALARDTVADVLLLDLMLPGLNGYEVCRTLRSEGATIPILVLTAKDGEWDEADALDLGADGYLTKPFSFVVLLAHIRALLRRTTVDREPVLTAGDLRLDPASRRVWRGTHEVVLTPREFALAEFLLRHKGLVCSRSMLADHVWDSQLDPESNVVDVYVGYLRKKLDRPFGTTDIETLRGVGYRLRGDDAGAV